MNAMDKVQAIHNFWSRFLTAYNKDTVPPDAEMPYITYSVATDSIGTVVNMTATLWYHTDSWREITAKVEEIGEYIVKMYPPCIKLDHGRLYIAKGKPFAQSRDDPYDRSIRRYDINIQAEFQTYF